MKEHKTVSTAHNEDYRILIRSVSEQFEHTEPLPAEEMKKVTQILCETFLSVRNEVDDGLVGGVRMQVGDTVYDGTLAHQLDRLSQEVEFNSRMDDQEELSVLESIREKLSGTDNSIDVYQTGKVISVSDGICHVSGLADVMAGEMLEFEGSLRGMVMDLDKNNVGVVLLGGLIDGVNPCAFATLIFFLSYLQIARRSPRELLLTGGSFVLSVYLTYFAIGLAFHELIGQLQAWSSLKMVMDVLFSLLALLAAVLSFRDAWLARRGRLADMSLTLPDFLKKRIRRTAREQSKSARFIVAAFAAGIVISALELACTGQVYAPIIYQIRQGSSSAVGMLALYNLAFILPLLLIFFLAYRGMKAEALIRYQQKHAFLVKMLLGVLFLCLAAIIVWGAVR